MSKEKDLEAAIKDFAHQISTPLIVINTGIFIVKKYLPILIKCYKSSEKLNKTAEEIPEESLSILEKLMEDSEQQIYFMDQYLKQLIKDLEEK